MCIDLGPALAISNPYIPIGWILNTKVREGRLSDCRPCPKATSQQVLKAIGTLIRLALS